ncbi:endonuclease MutS2 [bacterium]|nr:endonuclease MutS2 [bacterium]
MNILEKSKKTLELDKVVSVLATYARTQQSQQLCLSIEPETDYEKIQENINFTKEAKELIDKLLELPIEHLTDLNTIDNNQLNSYLSERELLSLAKSLRSARLVKNFMRENTISDSCLSKLSMQIVPNKELEDQIFAKFDEADNIKKDATDVLSGLYSSLKEAEKEIKTKINELLNSHEFAQYLQEPIYTIRDNRIVFPIMASAKGKISGITHDVSATNKTAYIEPSQLVSMNNKIRELKVKIRDEVIKILTELTRQIKKNYESFKLNERVLAELDMHFAKARYAIKIQAVEPELTREKVLELNGIKHPLLISRVPNIVTNDFSLGNSYTSLIITGSNTGGKTVTLKTVGLFTLMTRMGMFLPCLNAKLYPFEKVLADIGDEQDLMQNLSTFSSHMNNIINILNIADENTLVLLDEICAGTDPQEGASLAEVILDELVTKKALCVTTTHFGELKTLEYTNSHFKNACVEFDRETLQPTYKLTIGIPGASNAIFIAGNLGLKSELVERAKSTLNIQRDPSAVIIEKLQETQQKLSKNLQDVEMMKVSSQKAKDDYEAKLAELRRDKRKTIKAIESRFSEEFDNVRLEIKDIMSELRKEKSEKVARRSYTRLSYLENDLKDQIDNAMDKQTYDELIWESIRVGDTVMIKELNQPVTVVSLPDKNNNLTVQMGQIKTKISKDRVAKLDSSLTHKPQLKLRPLESFELKRSGMSNTLDLRGYKVDEALDSLESYLDKASLANLTPVYIVHGHGTGALRTYIRDYVSTSPYVAKFRPGEQAEGGDGVTIIDIN